jgi:hypothetical protein
MELTFDGDTTSRPVAQVRVLLEPDACVAVQLRLGFQTQKEHEDFAAAGLRAWAATRKPAALYWEDERLDLIVCGFDWVERADGEKGVISRKLEILALPVCRESNLVTWLDSAPSDDHRRLLIYQRQDPAVDVSGSVFLQRLFASRLATPPCGDRLEAVFPPGAAVYRGGGVDNFRFVQAVVGHLHRRLPWVLGWCGFAHEREQVRLVTSLYPPPLELDAWTPPARLCSTRLAARDWSSGLSSARRDFTVARRMKLLIALCTKGRPATPPEGQTFGCDDLEQLLFIPGPVRYKTAALFARQITYTFDQVDRSVQAEIRFGLSRPMPAPEPLETAFLAAEFHEWTPGERSGMVKLRPPPAAAGAPAAWTLMSDKPQALDTPDPGLPLLAEVLMPSTLRPAKAQGGNDSSDQLVCGLYVRHQKGDEMRVTFEPGAVPAVLGSPQRHHAPFETSDLTLNGGRITLTTSPMGTDPASAELLDLNGTTGQFVLRNGKGDRTNQFRIEREGGTASLRTSNGVNISVGDGGTLNVSSQHVQAMGNVTVQADSTTSTGNITIQGELTVGT